MKTKTTRSLVVCLVLLLAITPVARAFWGIGDIVYDPSVYAQAVQQVLQLEMQYEQLVQHFLILKGQYEHMRRMAQTVPVNMSARYRAMATPWRGSGASNVYGTTGGWVSAVNSGAGVAEGYGKAIEQLAQYGSAFSNVPADQQDRLKTTYATVELTDGANKHTLETLGRLRANSTEVERAIQGLEDDSLSSDPNMNTEIAVLNKINAANLVAIRGNQDTNQLLVAMAETQAVDAKRKRDAEARAINNHIRFLFEGKAITTAQAAGASTAMSSWRMP